VRLASAIDKGELVLTHAENGWTTTDVAIAYLHWLQVWFSGEPIVLVWDVFAAHRAQEVQELTPTLSILLKFVPAGMTGKCQPLDRRIFGSLKSRARKRFDDLWIKYGTPTMEDSLVMMLKAWGTITQLEILDAWNF
jgi:hypothetical protein